MATEQELTALAKKWQGYKEFGWIEPEVFDVLALAEGYLAIQAERDVLKAQQEAIGEVMKDLPWNCAACRHQHTGRRLGNICIGCPCEQRTPEAQD